MGGMMATTTTLALALLLTLTQEEATPPAPPAEAAVEAPSPADSSDDEEESSKQLPMSRITLRDGQQLHGRVVHRDKKKVVVELAAGGRMELPAHLVASVKEDDTVQVRDDGQLWFQDPNRTRYLYAPSAMMLRRGEGYVSQKELFFTSAAVGLTDNITLQAGAVLPLWLVGQGGFNIIGGVKVGGSPLDRLHLAVGAQAISIPSFNLVAAGFLFGTATYGTPDVHVSLGVGSPFLIAGTTSVIAPQAITTLSANVRVGQNLALVTENWMIPAFMSSAGGQLPMLNSLALRIFGKQWAVDVGGIRVPGSPIPIPWLDFAYNFG
jgi:hypothetical protein